MAKSRIVVVEGLSYLVPRKKYKVARKECPPAVDTWDYIMDHIEDYGRLLDEEEELEEEEEEEEEEE